MSQTVREQLAEALEWLLEHAVDCTKVTCGRCVLLDAKAHRALDRHRAEPDPTPDLLEALELAVEHMYACGGECDGSPEACPRHKVWAAIAKAKLPT